MKSLRLLLGVALCAATATVSAQTDTWNYVSAGDGTTYAINSDGSLWSWGWNESGQLGIGSKTPEKVGTPQRMGTDNDWQMACGAKAYAFFIKTDGSLWAVGVNEFGVQGVGDGVTNHTTLTRIGTDNDWKYVTANRFYGYNGMAIKNDGSLWAWGRGNFGILGDGTLKDSAIVPQRVGTDNDWKTVSIGTSHVLAVKNDGTLWGWGFNNSSCLLDATNPSTGSYTVRVPVQLDDATDWSDVCAIDYSSYAIKNDGTLWCWGGNGSNILGLNLAPEVDEEGEEGEIPAEVTEPTQMTGLSGQVIAISGCEKTRAVATGSNGVITKVYTWGSNAGGALGNGQGVAVGSATIPVSYVPVEVALPQGVTMSQLTSGQLYSVVRTTDGKMYGWGNNVAGQLGNYVTEAEMGFEPSPIQVAARAEATEGVYTFDANAIPASLRDATKIILTGEWGTTDFQTLTAALGNLAGFPPAGNNVLKTIDLSGASIAENTSLYVNTGTGSGGAFKMCKALEKVILPTDGSQQNFVSLREAFMNCLVLSELDLTGFVNVSNITDAFYATAITEANLSEWNNVTAAEDAFGKCSALTNVSLSALLTVSRYMFNSCYALETIDWSTYASETAPVVPENAQVFQSMTDEQMAAITLLVPEAAYDSFLANSVWSKLNIQKYIPEVGVYTFTPATMPASLADAQKLILKGEWTTGDFQRLTVALGNNSGYPAAGNDLIHTIDMSQAEIAPTTSLNVAVGFSNKGVFYGLRALTTVIFPAEVEAASITNISGAFQNCTALEEVDLSTLTGLTYTTDAFYGATALQRVTLPWGFPLKSGTFDRCTALQTIDWSAYVGTEAPSFVSGSLPTPASGNKKDLTIIVPSTAYASFVANPSWSAYTIQEYTGTGVSTVIADDADTSVYDLQGHRLGTLENCRSLQHGIYIIGGRKVKL